MGPGTFVNGFAALPEPYTSPMNCRPGCGACCIAPSITSAIPGMPHGKPAGVRCVQLDDGNRCRLFGSPERPAVCGGLKPDPEMCGPDTQHAMHYLATLERLTASSASLSCPRRDMHGRSD